MSNTDSVETSAASVEKAIQDALEKLGAAHDDVVIEVLATPRSGVLGLGARDARVRVSRRVQVEATSGVTAPPPAPPPQRRDPQRQEPVKQEAPRQQAQQQPRQQQPRPQNRDETRYDTRGEPRQENRQPNRQADNRQENNRDDAPAREEPRPRNQPPSRAPRPPRPEQSRAPRRESSGESSEDLSVETGLDDNDDTNRRAANAEEQVKEASTLLKQILDLMNEKSEIRRGEGDRESIELEIKGDGSGILIGRHGQTLDALEYLLNRIVARRIKDAIPIVLDTESYRLRRRQQLHRMALSMGERAKREHEAVKLDPMPPRDRRIVHLALKDDPLITTRSAGEGFLRSVEIAPSENRRDRGDDGRGNKRDRERDRGRDQERPREREAPSSIGEQGGFKHGQKRII
jgi:spoIIIJ-associated protein